MTDGIPPAITTQDLSLLVGTTPVWVFQPGQLKPGLFWIRIINCSVSYGPPGTSINSFIWLSRNGSPAAPNAPGSFLLAPGAVEEFRAPGFIPINALSAVATMPNTPLTVEVG